jgi:hypothetical protein
MVLGKNHLKKWLSRNDDEASPSSSATSAPPTAPTAPTIPSPPTWNAVSNTTQSATAVDTSPVVLAVKENPEKTYVVSQSYDAPNVPPLPTGSHQAVVPPAENSTRQQLNSIGKHSEEVPIAPSWQGNNLWKQAYHALAKRDGTLVKAFRDYLAKEFLLEDVERDIMLDAKAVASIISRLVQKREDKQWRLKFSNSLMDVDISIRDQGEKLLKFTMWSDQIVKTALSSQPYAGLAWSVVSMVLPVSSTSSSLSREPAHGLLPINDTVD